MVKATTFSQQRRTITRQREPSKQPEDAVDVEVRAEARAAEAAAERKPDRAQPQPTVAAGRLNAAQPRKTQMARSLL